MRTVDAVERGPGVTGHRVDVLDRLSNRAAGEEAVVCIERERDRQRNAGCGSGPSQAYGLFDATERHRLGEVHPRSGERR
ncbi:unannotated protein [freshwater metagenome]|uniref:Unannotated protein n=1 Tax=freshwater metagenome TaxID=449393 RepID=A0A6J6X6H6_9ZZZZ